MLTVSFQDSSLQGCALHMCLQMSCLQSPAYVYASQPGYFILNLNGQPSFPHSIQKFLNGMSEWQCSRLSLGLTMLVTVLGSLYSSHSSLVQRGSVLLQKELVIKKKIWAKLEQLSDKFLPQMITHFHAPQILFEL